MLTRRQFELLMFINERIKETGIAPSFDEMKDAIDLRSKSGVHRLISALEERGFIRRLSHRARALEVTKLPEAASPSLDVKRRAAKAQKRAAHMPTANMTAANDDNVISLGVMGRIAAGTPIEALQNETHRISVPIEMMRSGEHYALEVQGDSMINAGILDGDTAIIQRCDTADSGDIVVALVQDQEATLKRLRRKGNMIALEAANPSYETRLLKAEQVRIQGRLVGLIRKY